MGALPIGHSAMRERIVHRMLDRDAHSERSPTLLASPTWWCERRAQTVASTHSHRIKTSVRVCDSVARAISGL